MGKTVAAYRQALKHEIETWKGFRKALRTEDADAFDKMMNASRMFASAGSMATRPVLFEAMMVSILLHQEKMLMEISERLDGLEDQLHQP